MIPYQLFEIQAPGSNTFPDILLTSLKCSNLQRDNSRNFFMKSVQKFIGEIYSSSSINKLSFKSLFHILLAGHEKK